MDKFKGLAKKGWHPEKEGGIRNSMKGMIGKGDSSQSSSSYSSTPYVKKDPSTFAPPPVTRRYGEGDRPVPAPRVQPGEEESVPSVADGSEDMEEPTYERGPFVINKSGKDISKFAPPPPTRRAGSSASPVVSSSRVDTLTQLQSQSHSQAPVQSQPRPSPQAKPSLPPRLPPRTPSAPTTPIEQPASNGHLNQTAINRLGNSGIKVAGFGIGSSNTSAGTPSLSTNPITSNLRPTSTTNSTDTGTTWAEKQAAIKTANQLRTNPNNVSMAEIRGAASTAKNFQDRHGDQVASGVQTAQAANQKYNIADRVNQLSIASGKGAPPPIPAKKNINGSPAPAPPPLPMSSKPRPG